MDQPQFVPQVPGLDGEGTGVAPEQWGAPGDVTSPMPGDAAQIGQGQADEQQRGVDLTKLPDFREWQSRMDRQVAYWRQQAEQTAQQLEEMRRQVEEQQRQQREIEFQQMLESAPPEQRARLQMEYLRARMAEEAAALEEQRANMEDQQMLAAWDRYYTNQWQIEPEVLQLISERASAAAGGDMAKFHDLRHAWISTYYVDRAEGRIPNHPYNQRRRQQASTVPQSQQAVPGQTMARQPIQPQPTARPGSMNPGVPDITRLWSEGRLKDLKAEINRISKIGFK